MVSASPRRPAIIVPLDGSASARAALPVARALAHLEGATLHVLHVSEPVLCATDANERLAVDGDEAFVVETCGGDPVAAILEATRRFAPATVVLSAHCGHPQPGTGLGHVSEAVLRDAGVPVVFVQPRRGEAPWEPHALLLPLDGSPGSAQAVLQADDLARRTGAELVLLHVVAPAAGGEHEAGSLRAPRYADQAQHEWPAWKEEFKARAACGCKADQAHMRVRVAQGAPGPETVRVATAEHSDLIVVAWHGVLDEAHAATLRTVLTGASCPVMVVRV